MPTFGGESNYAWGVNNLGQIVGYSHFSDELTYHAFLYDEGAMYDLNDLAPNSGWELREAQAINENGWIVGSGVNQFGQTHAFLATPNPVPEPTSIALLAIAVAGIGAALRRRHKA